MKNYSGIFLAVSSLLLTACTGDIDQFAQDNLYPISQANETLVPNEPPVNYTQALLVVPQPTGSIKTHLWTYRNSSNPNASVIIFNHGNGENIGEVSKGSFLKRFENMGFHFVIFDYPGYGKSTGFPTQATVMASAQAVFDWTQQQYPSSKIHLWGWSLGSAVAIQMTQLNQQKVSSSVFSSPFKDVKSMAEFRFGSVGKMISEAWMNRNSWNSGLAAVTINTPVLITHGTKDEQIPYLFGQELFNKFPRGIAQFIPYEGKTHSSFFGDDEYWNELAQFFQSHD